MKRAWIVAGLALTPLAAFAANKPCPELKTEIAKKIESHHARNFTLEIAPQDAPVKGKTVGSCDGGTKKIVYRRGERSHEKQ